MQCRSSLSHWSLKCRRKMGSSRAKGGIARSCWISHCLGWRTPTRRCRRLQAPFPVERRRPAIWKLFAAMRPDRVLPPELCVILPGGPTSRWSPFSTHVVVSYALAFFVTIRMCMLGMQPMNMKKLLAIVCVAVALGIATTASAGYVVVTTTTEEYTPKGNDFQESLDGIFGGPTHVWEGTLQFTAAGTLYLYYHGAESGYVNSFTADTATMTEGDERDIFNSPLLIGTISVSAGEVLGPGPVREGLRSLQTVALLPLWGCASLGSSDRNLARVTRTSSPMITSISATTTMEPSPDDDNHDDMIVSAYFEAAVPEPLSVAVWAVLGVVGLAPVRRRNRS